MKREIRSVKARELRAESEDGKLYLSGYAAKYNVLSEELGWGMRERIVPGAFKRAVDEGQDVRHLINHDPNLVLGRTKSGTTQLTEDGAGLKFRTLLPDTQYANDLYRSVSRGDIDECSFGFVAVRTAWIEEPDPDNETDVRIVRELHDVDLFDVSTVTYPAYPSTNTKAGRSLFPDGIPSEIRSRIEKRDGACGCDCPECGDGDCANCSNTECVDENCRCMRARSRKPKTKKVDGEDLTAERFLIVGSPEDTNTWKLPCRFATEEKTAAHLRNALVRFNQVEGASDEERASAWARLLVLAKEQGIDPTEESLRSHLTDEQAYDFQKDDILARAHARVRVVKATL